MDQLVRRQNFAADRTPPGIELNLQTFTFRVGGVQMQALDEDAAKNDDVLKIFGGGAKTMQCVSPALLQSAQKESALEGERQACIHSTPFALRCSLL